MTNQLHFTCRDFTPPLLAEERVRDHADKLAKLYPRMNSLHVAVEQVQHRHHKGKEYQFRIVAHMPGSEVAVTKAHAKNHAHEDFFVAMRDSFKALEHRLKTFAEKQDLDVKVHELPPRATVTGLFPNYGFLRTEDGQEIYFHAHSLKDGKFEDLEIGTPVQFTVAEDESDKGPQAASVRPVTRHGRG